MNPTTDLTKSTQYTEEVLCGSLLLDTDMISRVAHLVAPEDFTHGHYGKLYGIIIKLWKKGLTVEPALVAAEMDEADRELPLDAVESVGSAVNAPHLAERIADASNRRKVTMECRKGAMAVKSSDDSVVGLIGGIQSSLASIVTKEDGRSVEQCVMDLQHDSEEAAKREDGVPGIRTGYRKLDRAIGGLTGGDLILIAARPSVGKTAFGVNILDNINLDFSNGVCDTKSCLFSLEMGKKQILLRIIARESGINLADLRSGNLTAEEWVRYTTAAGSVSKRVSAGLFIDDKPKATLGYIEGAVRNRMRTDDIGAVLIDYANIMGVEGKFEGRVAELNHISAGGKGLAKTLDVPVMMLVQIGRQSEQGTEMTRPKLSDMKGSGSWEEDCDIAILLHRAKRDSPRGEINIEKNRNGGIGGFHASYDGGLCSYKEI